MGEGFVGASPARVRARARRWRGQGHGVMPQTFASDERSEATGIKSAMRYTAAGLLEEARLTGTCEVSSGGDVVWHG